MHPRPAAEALYRRARPAVLAQGCILAFAGYVPLLNLLVPILSGLAFTHFGLARLAELRTRGA